VEADTSQLDMVNAAVQWDRPQMHDASAQTVPSPSYSVVKAEVTDACQFVANSNENKTELLEVVKRSYRLVNVDPRISDIEFKLGGTRIELVVKCYDTRAALGEKGIIIKQITNIIQEALGVKSLAVFVQRI